MSNLKKYCIHDPIMIADTRDEYDVKMFIGIPKVDQWMIINHVSPLQLYLCFLK